MLEKNIKYKQIVRLQVYGDDDLYYNSTSSQYILPFTISSITVSSAGSGYGTEAPILVFNGGGGSNLIANAAVSSGAVSSITVSSRGNNYTSLPQIYQKHSTVGTVQSVTVNTGGTGYPASSTLPIIISGGGGFDATATASTNSSGVITSISMGNKGYNYSSAPTIQVIGTYTTALTYTVVLGTGTLATLTAVGQATNAKRMRFDLKGALADVILSRNARAIVEMCCIPTITNMGNKTAILRLCTSTQDKVFDTKKFLTGNPILLSMPIASTANTLNTLYNATEFFYNVNIPSNFLSNGYIDMELECPSATSNIDFLTNTPLNNFYINFVIIDEDLETTLDTVLAPPINMKNYNVNYPIKMY